MKNYFLERIKKKEELREKKVMEVIDEYGNKIKLPPGIKIKLSDLKPMNYSDAKI